MEVLKKFATRETKKDNRSDLLFHIQFYLIKVFRILCHQKMLSEELVPVS